MSDHHFVEHHPGIAKMGEVLHNPMLWMMVAFALFLTMLVLLGVMSTAENAGYSTYPMVPFPFIH